MTQRRLFALVVAPSALLLASLCALGDDAPQNKTASATQTNTTSTSSSEKLNSQNRMLIIRGLQAELGYARRPFPMGRAGVTLKNGAIADESKLTTAVAAYGPALKPGDQARITQIIFRQKSIIFEINGGPIRKKKWYEHVEIDAMGGGYTPGQNQQSTENMNMHGTFVQLAFDNYVPNLDGDQVKKMLDPVLDFHAKSAAEAYLDTVPPKVKAAIKNHQILVGMDHDMVIDAKGRPGQKIREKDPITGNEFEEWIYGNPPQEVQFVRFNGDEVVRLEVMQVNGQKVIKTEREFDAPKKPTVDVAQQGGQPQVVPVNRPSLRRPGEDGPDNNGNTPVSPRTSPSPQQIPPTTTPGGPDDPNQGGARPSPTPGGPGVDIPQAGPQTGPGPQTQPMSLPIPTTTRTTIPDNNGPTQNGPSPNGTGPN
jgi:hypothetical protein